MRPPNSTRTIQEILESDDELLTSDYVETSYVPAYQDDTRFDYLQKNKTESHKSKRTPKISTLKSPKCVKKAIFNQKDLLCLQCVQQTIPTNTFLWFFEFLLQKDSHANHKFLTSCLVNKYETNNSKTNPVLGSNDKSNFRYKIIVME